jgi:hypothetical protein
MRIIFVIVMIISTVKAFKPISYLAQLERQTKELYIKNNMGLLLCNTTIILNDKKEHHGITGKNLDQFFW